MGAEAVRVVFRRYGGSSRLDDEGRTDSALTEPKKVRYLRYASSLVTAAYRKYASFLGIRKP